MISFLQARKIAENTIKDTPYRSDDELIIVDDGIIEKPYAWIFPWTSKRWLEGDYDYAIGGNGPLFVDKQEGRISTFRTGLSIEGMIDEYEEQNKVWSLKILTDIFLHMEKLLALKRHLHLTQNDIVVLRSNHTSIIATGAKTRLDGLARLLRTSNIESEIVLTS